MSNKVPVSGVVEQVSDSGFKVAGKWYNRARNADKYQAPAVGHTVSFDAYGQQQNVVYAIRTTEGNGNGQAASSAGTGGVRANGMSGVAGAHGNHSEPTGAGVRAHALTAAATLLQGSEGNVEQVASNTVAIARIFEVYLGGKQTQQEEDMI